MTTQVNKGRRGKRRVESPEAAHVATQTSPRNDEVEMNKKRRKKSDVL
jgi:hypothetical protein